MRSLSLEPGDQELIDTARELIEKRFDPERHHVGVALRGVSGAVYAGVNIEARVGRASVCAETVALGRGLTVGETRFSVIVGLMHPHDENDAVQEIHGGAPCGACRELLGELMPDGYVILPVDREFRRVSVVELLPLQHTHELR